MLATWFVVSSRPVGTAAGRENLFSCFAPSVISGCNSFRLIVDGGFIGRATRRWFNPRTKDSSES